MRIGRAIIFPAILTLSVAGSSLAITAASTTAAHTSNVHVVASRSVYLHTSNRVGNA